MKQLAAAFVLLIALAAQLARGAEDAESLNPLQKVIQLLTDLQGKIIADGEKEQHVYNVFVKWCGKSSSEKQAAVKESTSTKEELEARIEKAETDAASASSQISALSGSIASDEADLKAATLLREKENQDFQGLDQQLSSTIDMLARARRVLEKHLQKAGLSGKSFLQKPTQGMQVFTAALSQLVSAATAISEADRAILAGLLQRQRQGGELDTSSAGEGDEDGEDALGAPSGAVYTSHSGGVLESLEDLQSKAEDAQNDARKGEQNARHNFDMLQQSLQGKLDKQGKELEDCKKDLAQAQGVKASSEKELSTCTTDLKNDIEAVEKLQHDCMTRATQFSEEVRTRKSELDALAQAKKSIQDTSDGAGSFLQVAAASSASAASAVARGPSFPSAAAAAALKQLRALAKAAEGAAGGAAAGPALALAQLASRASAELRYALAGKSGGLASSRDPFAKVKDMINRMVEKLQKEAQAETDQKAFCDREMARTAKSKDDKEDEVGDLSTHLDSTAAEVARLQEQLKTLAEGIHTLEENQAEADNIRREENANYLESKQDLSEGLTGVQRALSILRDYYGSADDDESGGGASFAQEDVAASMAEASSSSDQARGGAPAGAGASIIGLLQVVQSDLAQALTEAQASEEVAMEAHNKFTQENRVTRAAFNTEMKNKEAEVVYLRKRAAELKSDRMQSQQELDAINEYWEKLQPQCTQPPETYQDRLQQREAEISGLKQALETLATSGS